MLSRRRKRRQGLDPGPFWGSWPSWSGRNDIQGQVQEHNLQDVTGGPTVNGDRGREFYNVPNVVGGVGELAGENLKGGARGMARYA